MVRNKRIIGTEAIRALALIGILCLLLSMAAMTAAAQGTAKIKVSSATADRDCAASVCLVLEGNPGIWGIKLRVEYDRSALTLKAVKAGSIFNQNEFMMAEDLSKYPFVAVASGSQIKNKTANGTVLTLQFAVNAKATNGDYAVSVEVVQANNTDGKNVAISAQSGKVTVVDCVHADKKWETVTHAQCALEGQEALTCQKCEKTFESRSIAATGHQNTQLKNAAAATKTQEGYTGDICCEDCGEVLEKGTVIPVLPGDPVLGPPPEMITGKNLVFQRNSGKDLVFVSSADLRDFICAELDGALLPEDTYTVTDGSTVLTIKAEHLDTLTDGNHTVSIISQNGSASTTFVVSGEGSSQRSALDTGLFILLGALVIAEGAALTALILQKRRARSC